MEKTEIITAEQAEILTLKNKATIDDCMREIQVQANNGFNYINVWKVVDSSLQLKLMELGFAISLSTNTDGMKITRITW